jgi:hypothetical protein
MRILSQHKARCQGGMAFRSKLVLESAYSVLYALTGFGNAYRIVVV